ncbi:hypothetical protein F0562_011577 [Nyssa sinensis]|uniref:CCHC-type domain-containing protein n=1 Tax=Nyssa sinensis TaxID=561372 RepID=A0A5J4ZST4_9ASTE|nr:hypothetical protein F0562_011577 [Nyssa sinensis]
MAETSSATANKSRFPQGDGQSQPKTAADRTQRGSVPSNNPVGTCSIVAATKEAPRVAPNPYAKSGGLKCYRCGQPVHCSNKCSARKPVNFMDVGENDESLGKSGLNIESTSVVSSLIQLGNAGFLV